MEVQKFYDLPEFNNVRRSLDENGNTLFCVGDVLKVLGYSRPAPHIFRRISPSALVKKESMGIYLTDERGVVDFIRRSSMARAKLLRERLNLGKRVPLSPRHGKSCPLCKQISSSWEKVKDHLPLCYRNIPRKLLFIGAGVVSVALLSIIRKGR